MNLFTDFYYMCRECINDVESHGTVATANGISPKHANGEIFVI